VIAAAAGHGHDGAVPLALLLAVFLGPSTAPAQDYAFPSSVEDYVHFYPTAYVDQGGHDWACGDIYYAGHRGTDLGAGSFAGMDEGRDITAAADGTVIATEDGWFDRCETSDCPGGGGFGNHVVLLHADGKSTIYAHLKQGSLLVGVGQTVSCGQKLGEMGSSGRSSGPHLHMEVRIGSTEASPYAGSSSDPFFGDCAEPPMYWVDQGSHGGLPALVCDGGTGCAPTAALTCGVPVTGANTAPDASFARDHWACSEFIGYTGGERAWTWAAAASEPVTVTMSPHDADLDLFVLEGPDCGATCIGASTAGGTDPESLTWDAVAGQTYTVVIDGWEGATSTFDLSITCTTAGDDDTTGDDDGSDDDSASAPVDDDSAQPADPGPFLPDAERLPAPLDAGCGCQGGASTSVLLLPLFVRRRRTAGMMPPC
jgi:murein DD-endopeptidase MepM/ murein hydrolase activator NlpD